MRASQPPATFRAERTGPREKFYGVATFHLSRITDSFGGERQPGPSENRRPTWGCASVLNTSNHVHAMASVKAPPTPLRVLYLEDNATDRALVEERLRLAGFDCDIREANNGAEFERALGERDYDLILSDFTLPSYDGAAALAAARLRQPHVPFIVVSGTIGEERAVDCLKNGATDYVLKGNLQRLQPAVARALREATEQRRREEAEAALRQSEERLREMAETIRDVFWVTSPDGQQILYVSAAYERIWGRLRSELYARPMSWLDAIPAEDREPVTAALARLAAGAEYQIEYRIMRPDGTVRWIEDRAYPVRGADGRIERALGVATDITERKELAAQLLQAQKMDAIGQLAGGVAHDFNNALTVINGYSRLLLDLGQLPPKVAEQMRLVYAAGMRAGNLTRQLLLFSRKHAVHKQVIDLNEHLRELAKLLGRLIGEHINLELNLTPTQSNVKADESMLEQIVMNLAVNARDAMPKGGRLHITTAVRRFGAPDLTGHSGRRIGAFVCLTVEDTGCGISEEVMPRIFEPFFTTKPPGTGTGLGLATVFGITQEHDGWIEVESRVGTGTAFHVYFPACSENPARQAEAPEAAPRAGSETVLLVEDETPVREFVAAVLAHFGYRVLQASCGMEALEVWKWHSSRIALLVSDMVMPDGVSGMDLAEALREQRPGLKVVLMSGYTSEMVGQLYTRRPNTHFIQKPFQPTAFAKLVRELLDGTDVSTNSNPPMAAAP